MFETAIFVVALVSGATASIVGFGIGSLLTPLLAARFGADVAIAAVMTPHALATALRCWRLRASIDRRILARFGTLSAVGGVGGALLYSQLRSEMLTRTLGVLLVMTSVAHLSGLASRWRPTGPVVNILGLLSGGFGGIAGNQGGLRAAALTAFALDPLALVATSTATGLLVDLARAPFYLWRSGPQLVELAIPIGVATLGVVIGTLAGERLLMGMDRKLFTRVLAGAIFALGLWLLLSA